MKCIYPECGEEMSPKSCYCEGHVNTFIKGNKCPAPPASDDKQSSKPSGAKPRTEPSGSDELTLRQSNTVRMILQLIRQQQEQINELTKGVEYLAQQVKTLVDALAEDQDPDAPLTHYMSGKAI